MKKTTLLFLLLFVPSCLYVQGQEAPPRAQTAAPDTARFEIVQSPLVVRWTFRLDKYTGKVWQLVKTKDDDLDWDSMPVVDLPSSPSVAKVRYQIFASGIIVRNTLLLNIETGQTWVLTTFKDKNNEEFPGWAPFGE